MLILVDPFDEAEKLSREPGNWVVAALETHIFWPAKKHTVPFDGKSFILLPVEHREPPHVPSLPAIALRADLYGLSLDNARRELFRFASAIAWQEGGKIEIVNWGGGGLPRSIGIIRNSGRSEFLDPENLPAPADERARAALAFYREGVSLDNPFYAFLSLYKAFGAAISDGRSRGAWMTAKKGGLDNRDARERLQELETGGNSVGDYLYEQCRHAIAHADREPFVNPDSTDDLSRLAKDLPLMRNFAELAIEEVFWVKRPSTIYREHLHELEGFRKIIPDWVIEKLKKREPPPEALQLDIPGEYFVAARRGHEARPLGVMQLVGGAWTEGGLVFDFHSKLGVATLRLILGFSEERLVVDPVLGFRIKQDRGSSEGIREELAALRFQECVLSNGHVEIWDASKETRLGCSETCIPVNCFVNSKFYDERCAELERLLAVT